MTRRSKRFGRIASPEDGSRWSRPPGLDDERWRAEVAERRRNGPRPDLRREFVDTQPDGESVSAVLRSLQRRQGHHQDWDWLLAARVVVVLNEAGAGKTTELMDQAGRSGDGREGFFLRIERLCRPATENPFESQADAKRFQRWHAANRKDAVIFLDAVDEAKLPRKLDRNPLSLAIRRLEGMLAGRLAKVRIVISSRPSAWTPEQELAEVERLARTFEQRGIKSGADDVRLSRFVTLAPLEADQMEILAAWAGAPPDFMKDLLETSATEFAQTPLDLLDLVDAYQEEEERGRRGAAIFASLKDIIDRTIERRIAETGSDVKRSRLTSGRARLGARRLAAACVLGDTLSIRLSGSVGTGIDPAAVLGDEWGHDEIEQLLACGLFSAAWEGAVRFDHRRRLDFLAGEAFDELLRAGMALDTLAELLMPEALGEVTTPGGFIQTVGWTATFNPAFQHRVLTVAPQHLLDTGDPGALPILVREAALRAYAARFAGGIWRSEMFEYRTMKRFVDPALQPIVAELIRTAPAEEPRRLMIDLAELGGFTSCGPAIADLLGDPSTPAELRLHAVPAAAALCDPVALAPARLLMLRFRPGLGGPDATYTHNRLRRTFVAFLTPTLLSLAEALGVLARLEPPPRSYSESHGEDLAAVIAERCPASRLPWLLKWLARLCWEPTTRPFGSWDTPRWTAVGRALLPTLDAVTKRIIAERPDLHASTLVVEQVERLMAARRSSASPFRYRSDDESPDELAAALTKTPALRRAIFYTVAPVSPKGETDEPGHVLEHLTRRFGFHRRDDAGLADLDWMADDYRTTVDDLERQALIKAIAWRLQTGPVEGRRARIDRFMDLARGRKDPEGKAAFANSRHRPIREVEYWIRREWANRPQTNPRRAFRHWRFKAKLRFRLWAKRDAVRAGKEFGLMWATIEERAPKEVLADVSKRYGPDIAEDVATGLKAYAQIHVLKEGTQGAELAFLGWSLLANDAPDAMTALTQSRRVEALRAAIAGTSWQDWATDLALSDPEAFRTAIWPSLSWELSWRSPHRSYAPGLALAARMPAPVRSLMAGHVLALLETATPEPGTLASAVAIVETDPAQAPALGALAARRCREHLAEGAPISAAIWFTPWMRHAPGAAWAALRDQDRAYGPPGQPWLVRLLEAMGQAVPLAGLAPDLLVEMGLFWARLFPFGESEDEETGRTDAQRVRDAIPSQIAAQGTQAARDALQRLFAQPPFSVHASWGSRMLRDQAAKAAAPRAMSSVETERFMATHLRRPADAFELHDLIVRQIEAIASDLAVSEFDRRGLFREALEKDVRAFLGDALLHRSQRWYSVTQETVTASEKRMDLRIEGVGRDGEIVIVELKIAGPSWTGDELVEHLESQLVGQYLISHRVRHGVYLVVDLGLRTQWPMIDGSVLTFEALIERMKARLQAFAALSTVDKVTVLPMRITVPHKVRKARAPRSMAPAPITPGVPASSGTGAAPRASPRPRRPRGSR